MTRVIIRNRPVIGLWILFATGACNRVEVKQDTPTATISTIVKLYAAGNDKFWNEVVESALVRGTARASACATQSMHAFLCGDALIKLMNAPGLGRMPEGCRGNWESIRKEVTDCTCGGPGDIAATQAPAFVTTDVYRGLKAEQLNPSSCEITNSTILTKEGLADLSDQFWERVCSDIPRTDEFASVTLRCSDEDPLGFILHKRDLKWALVGLDTHTSATLAKKAMASSAASAAEKRTQDLNKDLK